MTSDGKMRPVTVWDLPTRVFHWSLVLCIAGSWVTAQTGQFDLHTFFGYTALSLVLYRVIWGFVGSETSRFASFLRGPAAIRSHLSALLSFRTEPPHVGHNPVGGIAIVLMLGIIALQAGTGLFTSDGILSEGPFASRVDGDLTKALRTIHLSNINLMLALIAGHVGAIVFYRFAVRQDLLGPMLRGRLNVPAEVPQPRIVPATAAAAIFVLAAVGVWTVIEFI